MKNWLTKTKLIGKKVKLIPLEKSHKAALLEAAADGELWKLWFTSVPNEENIDAYLQKAFDEEAIQKALPFSVVDLKTNKIIGSTRFCSVFPEHRRLEIGYTWYAKSVQRTGVNTECKYLLLKHAFESLNAIAVEFKTNWFNYNSRKAILRIGAKQDGVIRNHRIDKYGNLRDTVIFSIIDREWETVKHHLEYQRERCERVREERG